MKHDLCKILSIDEEAPINYNHTEVSNEYIKKLTIDELIMIFDDGSDIFKHNTYECLTLILDDESEISLHEYKKGMNPVFIKISNDKLVKYDSEIYLYAGDKNQKDYYIQYGHMWQTEETRLTVDLTIGFKSFDDIPEELREKQFNGYANCEEILENINGRDYLGFVPAIDHCNKQKITIGENVYQGYLPALGQMMIIVACNEIINYVLDKTGSKTLLMMTPEIMENYNVSLWTSNEFNKNYAWAVMKKQIKNMTKVTISNGLITAFKKLK